MRVVQGRNGLAGSQTGRSFPKRSFVRPSWMDEDTVDSADTSESLFFSKVSNRSLYPPVSTMEAKSVFASTLCGNLLTSFSLLRMSAITLLHHCIRLSQLLCFSYRPPSFSKHHLLLYLAFFMLPSFFENVQYAETNICIHVSNCNINY